MHEVARHRDRGPREESGIRQSVGNATSGIVFAVDGRGSARAVGRFLGTYDRNLEDTMFVKVAGRRCDGRLILQQQHSDQHPGTRQGAPPIVLQ